MWNNVEITVLRNEHGRPTKSHVLLALIWTLARLVLSRLTQSLSHYTPECLLNFSWILIFLFACQCTNEAIMKMRQRQTSNTKVVLHKLSNNLNKGLSAENLTVGWIIDVGRMHEPASKIKCILMKWLRWCAPTTNWAAIEENRPCSLIMMIQSSHTHRCELFFHVCSRSLNNRSSFTSIYNE